MDRSSATWARLWRLIKPRRRANGYTFIEVVVSLLLTSVIVTAVFTVVVTTKASTAKQDRRVLATQVAKEITGVLRNFVTACCDPWSGTCCTAAGPPCAVPSPPSPTTTIPTCYSTALAGSVPGPNGGSWSFDTFPLYSGSGAVSDLSGFPYALQQGQHNLGNVLPAWFTGAPYGASVFYTVTPQVSGSQTYTQVRVDVDWTEPAP